MKEDEGKELKKYIRIKIKRRVQILTKPLSIRNRY